MSTSLYKKALKDWIPYIRFTTYYPDFKGQLFYEGYKILRPSDIVLTIDNKKLTSLLIGGEFSHAAFCVSKNEVFEFAEMTHDNYRRSTFFDICKESTRVVILRAKDWSETYKLDVIQKCLSMSNAKYDVEFSLGIEALYCSELVYHSDYLKTLDFDLSDLVGMGRPYLSPEGIYKCKNLITVWDSEYPQQYI